MYTKAKDFLENIAEMKKDEMKEILKLSTLITEEIIENGVSSKKESYIVNRKKEDELAYISDIEENILKNTDKENNIEYKANFYKLNEKDINKIADEIKNDNLSSEDFENLYSKKVKTIDFEEREKSRNFIEVFDFLTENLKKLDEKGYFAMLGLRENHLRNTEEDIRKERIFDDIDNKELNKNNFYFLVDKKNDEEIGGILNIQENKDVTVFLDKTLKFLAINGTDFSKKFTEYSEFQKENENLDKETAMKNVLNTPKISSELVDNFKFEVDFKENTEITDVSIHLSSLNNLYEGGLTIHNKWHKSFDYEDNKRNKTYNNKDFYEIFHTLNNKENLEEYVTDYKDLKKVNALLFLKDREVEESFENIKNDMIYSSMKNAYDKTVDEYKENDNFKAKFIKNTLNNFDELMEERLGFGGEKNFLINNAENFGLEIKKSHSRLPEIKGLEPFIDFKNYGEAEETYKEIVKNKFIEVKENLVEEIEKNTQEDFVTLSLAGFIKSYEDKTTNFYEAKEEILTNLFTNFVEKSNEKHTSEKELLNSFNKDIERFYHKVSDRELENIKNNYLENNEYKNLDKYLTNLKEVEINDEKEEKSSEKEM